jgi:hypothetical protein
MRARLRLALGKYERGYLFSFRFPHSPAIPVAKKMPDRGCALRRVEKYSENARYDHLNSVTAALVQRL